MSESLRDQLLKAGLVKKPVPENKPQNRSGRPSGPQQRPPGKGGGGKGGAPHGNGPRSGAPHGHAPKGGARSQEEIDLAKAYALRQRAENEERQRLEREAAERARVKKERKQKLGTLFAGKALNAADADVARHFPHGSKIRRVYVTADQLPRLNAGELAVVQHNGRYLLVEREIALAAQQIDEDALVLLCDPNAPAEDDVPADLVW
ncbi:MAG: DUF2058 domain-containing protein [Rhodanobacter denitrificans]|uniref:DUF2058 domain-containing protein n=1 Tax=Rhodanobacter denitrificans TaxID=666685 RepID=A0A2W5LRL8_9GAMM|nr:MAG: DUF2058 domain-containing protein [Rhodanobacter denitrificans]